MVSKKLTRRTPTKPKPKPKPKSSPILSRRLYQRRAKDSPLKPLVSAPSLVAASIENSIRTCRRRLFKIFSRLTTIGGTPKCCRKQKHGFRRLNSSPVPSPKKSFSSLPLLPPTEKKTVFLDLDETLVHSFITPTPPDKYDFIINPVIDGMELIFYVLKRPGVDEFLSEISGSYELVLFTASLEEYASLIVDQLDPKGEFFSHRLYRNACSEVNGKLVKNLVVAGRELDKVVIVDDNPQVYSLQPENAVPVRPFTEDPEDVELLHVMQLLKKVAGSDDMREAVKFLHENVKEEEDQIEIATISTAAVSSTSNTITPETHLQLHLCCCDLAMTCSFL